MSALTIRALTREDIPAFAALISASFAPVSDLYRLTQDMGLTPLTSRLEEGFQKEERQFGAWAGDEPQGYFSLDARDHGIFEINRLCVRPPAQRQGYGQQLLDRAIAEICRSGGRAAVCAVIGENTPVLHWLTRNGFFEEAVGCLPGMPCSVCILQRNLNPEPGGCAGCSGGCR
mgnify:CR=1 FL=1